MITYFHGFSQITILLFGIIAGYVTYKRSITLKLRYPKIMGIILGFIIIFIIAYLIQDGLIDYLNKTIFTRPDSRVDIFTLSIFLLVTGLYLSLLIITEDLLKNINVLINFFVRKTK